jgi:hypothetical protein
MKEKNYSAGSNFSKAIPLDPFNRIKLFLSGVMLK